MRFYMRMLYCSPSLRLYIAFYILCSSLFGIYLFCMNLYHPLLLPTTFNSQKLLIHNPHLCSRSENVTVMFIYSNPAAHRNREIIRRTYGNVTEYGEYNLKLFFVMGRTEPCVPKGITFDMLRESELHKDIIIGDFLDTYRNLSLKGIKALDFIHSYCPNSRFVIKADDDVLVNTPALLKALHKNHLNKRRTIWGALRPHNQALYCLRRAFNKWCVLPRHYNRKYYPPYMFGAGYVLSGDLVSEMLNATKRVPPYPLDDVYMTGLLLEQISNVSMVDWDSHITEFKYQTTERVNSPTDKPLYFGHSLIYDQIEQYWNKLNNQTNN